MGDLSLWKNFRDHPRNPILEPPRFAPLLADPTVLAPHETPNGRWHLFAHTLRGVHHYVSEDGFDWEHRKGPLFFGLRPCVRLVEGRYYLFYERYVRPWESVLEVRYSDDLRSWSKPHRLLEPSLPWEGRFPAANGNPGFVSGPFGYRLYYSASAIFLPDCLFLEPRHIGVAEADSILGPYRKRSKPIISPSADVPWRNFGAGAIKVFYENGRFIGLNNGIYKDAGGHSRSAIYLLESADGLSWKQAHDKPLVAPEGNGWKKALVYALDVVRLGDELRLYYNARDGWFIGKERIGVAVARRGR